MTDIIYTSTPNKYDEYIDSLSINHTVKTIDGRKASSSKCIGYCSYHGHPGFITKEQRMHHNCTKNQCDYYIAKSARNNHEQSFDTTENQIMHLVKEETSDIQGVKALRTTKTNNNTYIVFFVTITNDYSFESCILAAYKTFGVSIIFYKLDYDYEKSAAIILAE